MAKSNGKKEENYDNTVRVGSTTSLPYAYIPYTSIADARIKHPDDKLYIYEPGVPAGYKIVALPVQMEKPEEEVEAEDA